MSLIDLEHVNVRTTNLAVMEKWYERVLGMVSGKRPNFGFPGAWLYLGARPVVHLVEVAETSNSDDLQIEHYAFRAADLEEFLAHLKAEGVENYLGQVPGFGITQVNILDPDGNHIHVDFESGEAG